MGTKVTDLTALGTGPEDTDVLVMVDISEDETKKITVENLFGDTLRNDGTLNYDGLGTLTTTNFSGDGSGLTGVSVSSISANDVGSGSHYVLLRNSATGQDSVNTDGNLVYDPASDTLSATNFSGNGSGITNVSAVNATNATNIAITDATSTAGTYYLQMGGSTSGNDGVDVHSDVSYDQATKTLTLDKLVLSNLPTSDPTIAGALWNDSGTIKISAG